MIYNKFFVIDSHCHIYPEKIASKAVAGTDNFYKITVSAHGGTTAELMEIARETGIDRFVVESVATTPKQVKSINEFIAEEVEKSDGKFIGVGTLHPDSEDIAGDIDHLLELGLKGVKLHPDIQAFKIDDYRCLKIYEICEEKGIPILMHTGDNRYDFSNPNRLAPILEIYKNLTVIGAHFGGYSVWFEAAERLKDFKNFYVDCSSSFFALTDEEIMKLIREYGTEKVLFGTDFPMWSPKSELERFMNLPLSDEEKTIILSKNALKIYGE
ncbi:MAG: amidohydrolase family protein [Clostridia bacterium]|nr:amidohydrolase family protein [Clostridia bacterium]